jgi:hypothetical protein
MSNQKILIVDDDPDIRPGMHVRLKANHYDTSFAGDAVSCMTEARKHSLQQPVDDAEPLAIIRKVLGEPAWPGEPAVSDLRSGDFRPESGQELLAHLLRSPPPNQLRRSMQTVKSSASENCTGTTTTQNGSLTRTMRDSIERRRLLPQSSRGLTADDTG